MSLKPLRYCDKLSNCYKKRRSNMTTIILQEQKPKRINDERQREVNAMLLNGGFAAYHHAHSKKKGVKCAMINEMTIRKPLVLLDYLNKLLLI